MSSMGQTDDAERFNPSLDETDIRVAMADDLQRMDLMPEPVEPVSRVAETQEYELTAFLGTNFSEDQARIISELYVSWERPALRFLNSADPDEVAEFADERTRVLTAVVEHVDGVLDLLALADAEQKARREAFQLRAQLRAGVIASLLGGVSKSEVHRKTGVSRSTIDAWMSHSSVKVTINGMEAGQL